MRIQSPKKHPWYRRNCTFCSCQSRNRRRFGTRHKADKTASLFRVLRCRLLHNRQSSTGCRKTVPPRHNLNARHRTGTMRQMLWSSPRVCALQHTTTNISRKIRHATYRGTEIATYFAASFEKQTRKHMTICQRWITVN